MTQAEKLIWELEQKCGVDFNNPRRPLALSLVNHYFEQAVSSGVKRGIEWPPDDPTEPSAADLDATVKEQEIADATR